MEREDLTNTQEKAKRWQSRTKIREGLYGQTIDDFMWRTGQWCWLPRTETGRGHLWNPNGGPAFRTRWRKRYWLTLGWSTIEVVPDDDPVDTLHNGGTHGGA